MSRLRSVPGVAARAAAWAVLAVLLAGVPAAAVALVAGEGGVADVAGALRRAGRTGRLDTDAVVAVGLAVFVLLWAWFACSAVGEAVRVMRWRRWHAGGVRGHGGSRTRGAATPLPATLATPTGWVRGLVRVALLSGVAVGPLLPVGQPGLRTAAVGAAATGSHLAGAPADDGPTVDAGTGAAALRSNGRETPYSIAVRLGDAGLRDRVIEANRGRGTPDGGTWTGGVFPAGMMVVVPDGVVVAAPVVSWEPYTVREGDSVYRIAAALSAGEARRVRDIADLIIERNLGRTMADGRLFEDPSLIRPGWVLDVPREGAPVVAGVPADVDARVHVVEPGESYWEIAEEVVGADDPAEVHRLTEALIAANASGLARTDPTLLLPGDVLVLPGLHTSQPADAPPVAPVGSVAPDGAPPDEAAPPDPAPAASAVATTPPAPDPAPAASAVATTPPAPDPAAPRTPDAQQAPTSIAGPAAPRPPEAQPAPTPGVAPAAPPPATIEPTAPAPAAEAPVSVSLGGALLLCAGALSLVEIRRRHQLRKASLRTRLPTPGPHVVRTERLLRTLGAAERAVRLDLALRVAGHQLAGTGGYVRAVLLTDEGEVTLLLDRAGRTPAPPYRQGDDGRWVLPAGVDDDELVDTARLAGQPCPALVHVGALVRLGGRAASGDVFVDLEAFGALAVDGPAEAVEAILRGMAASLAVSPVGETLHVVTHQLGGPHPLAPLPGSHLDATGDLDAAFDLAASLIGSTPALASGRRTFELRARGVGGESWEPAVVVSGAPTGDLATDADVVALGGGRGLALVVGRRLPGAPASLVAGADGWELRPLDLVVVPVGVTAEHLADVGALLQSADADPLPAPEPRDGVGVHDSRALLPDLDRAAAVSAFEEPAWEVLVRVLGPVRVETRAGATVRFERGKAQELVTWLALHRTAPTRGAARAALWELAVRDATFSNVVSEARRALASAVPSTQADADGDEEPVATGPGAATSSGGRRGPGVEWIGRTLTEALPLHPLVVTDADLLRARVRAADGLPPREAIAILRPGLELVEGMPFSGTDHLWPDAEGITSALVVLATGAAAELARHHLAIGDIDGVFWATGRGLAVLRGHEELIGLRMRAHAMRGNLAGVRHEWEFYERALDADPWSASDPSPALVSLRRELLS